MHEAIVKYALKGMEWVKQGINTICAKFHVFTKIIKGVLFLERSKYISQFCPYIAQMPEYIDRKATTVHFMPYANIKSSY